MPEESYKNHQVEWAPGDDPKVAVDGVEETVTFDPEAGSYAAARLPYRTFDDLGELARAVVDQREQ